MDILPISVCYAAMLVKVVQGLGENKDLPKHQILVNHNSTVSSGGKLRSSLTSIETINQNKTSSKKLVQIYNTTEDDKTIQHFGNNDSSRASLTKETGSEKVKVALLHRINYTLTRSKDAVWATISLTFICILLLLAVAHSRMWKDYHGSETQYGIPRPNFNERVPFKEVLEHKMASLKEFIKRKHNSKRSTLVELEALIHNEV